MGLFDVLAIVILMLPLVAIGAIAVAFFGYILYAPPLKHNLPDAGGKLTTTGSHLSDSVRRARGEK